MKKIEGIMVVQKVVSAEGVDGFISAFILPKNLIGKTVKVTIEEVSDGV